MRSKKQILEKLEWLEKALVTAKEEPSYTYSEMEYIAREIKELEVQIKLIKWILL